MYLLCTPILAVSSKLRINKLYYASPENMCKLTLEIPSLNMKTLC